MSRINCHSAFKHYEMFHSQGGDVINIGSNNTTIFNMGTGFGGGSFWSGLGYGLGNGLGSIFGGLFGGNMGSFGNFGFGTSPFGMGGFGNFGFGMSPFGSGNIWGGGSNRVDSSSDGKGKVKDSKDDKHGKCEDPDLKKINGFRDDVQGIQDLEKPDKAKVKAKYDEIVKAKKDQDDTHKAENTAAYDNLLEDLQKIADKNGWGKLDDKTFGIDKPAATPETKVDGTGKKDDVTPTEQTSGTTPGSATGKIDTANLTADQIKALTPEQISSLTPDEAKSLLDKLGALNDDKNGVKATTNYKTLLLAQKSGLPLSCGHNVSLDNLKGADAYLKGKVSNVTLNGDDITFEVETDNVKLKMKCKADSSSYEIDETIERKSEKYKDATKGTKYELKAGQEYAERTGVAAMKRK